MSKDMADPEAAVDVIIRDASNGGTIYDSRKSIFNGGGATSPGGTRLRNVSRIGSRIKEIFRKGGLSGSLEIVIDGGFVFINVDCSLDAVDSELYSLCVEILSDYKWMEQAVGKAVSCQGSLELLKAVMLVFAMLDGQLPSGVPDRHVPTRSWALDLKKQLRTNPAMLEVIAPATREKVYVRLGTDSAAVQAAADRLEKRRMKQEKKWKRRSIDRKKMQEAIIAVERKASNATTIAFEASLGASSAAAAGRAALVKAGAAMGEANQIGRELQNLAINVDILSGATNYASAGVNQALAAAAAAKDMSEAASGVAAGAVITAAMAGKDAAMAGKDAAAAKDMAAAAAAGTTDALERVGATHLKLIEAEDEAKKATAAAAAATTTAQAAEGRGLELRLAFNRIEDQLTSPASSVDTSSPVPSPAPDAATPAAMAATGDISSPEATPELSLPPVGGGGEGSFQIADNLIDEDKAAKAARTPLGASNINQ